MRWVLALLLAVPLAVAAQAYPSKPVRVVVPYPAGSTPDTIGRALAERLQSAMGQPFIVENRSGAGGNIGASGGEGGRPTRAADRRQRAGRDQQAPLQAARLRSGQGLGAGVAPRLGAAD